MAVLVVESVVREHSTYWRVGNGLSHGSNVATRERAPNRSEDHMSKYCTGRADIVPHDRAVRDRQTGSTNPKEKAHFSWAAFLTTLPAFAPAVRVVEPRALPVRSLVADSVPDRASGSKTITVAGSQRFSP